jgi:hypothetical protein
MSLYVPGGRPERLNRPFLSAEAVIGGIPAGAGLFYSRTYASATGLVILGNGSADRCGLIVEQNGQSLNRHGDDRHKVTKSTSFCKFILPG